MDILTLITTAIANRQIVTFVYGGYNRGVEPFTLGRLRNGTMVLSCYQITSRSRSGSIPDWRLFNVSQMSLA